MLSDFSFFWNKIKGNFLNSGHIRALPLLPGSKRLLQEFNKIQRNSTFSRKIEFLNTTANIFPGNLKLSTKRYFDHSELYSNPFEGIFGFKSIILKEKWNLKIIFEKNRNYFSPYFIEVNLSIQIYGSKFITDEEGFGIDFNIGFFQSFSRKIYNSNWDDLDQNKTNPWSIFGLKKSHSNFDLAIFSSSLLDIQDRVICLEDNLEDKINSSIKILKENSDSMDLFLTPNQTNRAIGCMKRETQDYKEEQLKINEKKRVEKRALTISEEEIKVLTIEEAISVIKEVQNQAKNSEKQVEELKKYIEDKKKSDNDNENSIVLKG